jgi:membrane protein DedA with SNARE-associated domain
LTPQHRENSAIVYFRQRPFKFNMLLNVSRNFLAPILLFFFAFSEAAVWAMDSSAPVPAAARSDPTASQAEENIAVSHFQHALARVQPYIKRYGYWAATGAVLLEGVGIPTPGQTLLMAGALEAADQRMNLALLLSLVTAGAVLGNSIGYAIGRWAGRVVLKKLNVNPQRQERVETLFEKYGGLIVLLGRFVDGLRQLNGIVSGMMKMPWGVFTAYNVAGAILWTGAWGVTTYYLGRRIHAIAAFFHYHRSLLFILTATLVLALLVYLLRPRSRP